MAIDLDRVVIADGEDGWHLWIEGQREDDLEELIRLARIGQMVGACAEYAEQTGAIEVTRTEYRDYYQVAAQLAEALGQCVKDPESECRVRILDEVKIREALAAWEKVK